MCSAHHKQHVFHTTVDKVCLHSSGVQKLLRISEFEKNRGWIMRFEATMVLFGKSMAIL